MATYKNLRKVLNLPTLSESPSSGANGEMYFNTTDSALYIYDAKWKKVTQSGIGPDWTAGAQQAKLTSADVAAGDQNGQHVAISGNTIVVGGAGNSDGGSYSGAAYVFTRSGTTWSQQAKLLASDAQASDFFGEALAIDGDTIVVTARGEDTGAAMAGAMYVFIRSGTSWSQQAKLQASDRGAYDSFGQNVAIEGNTIIVGSKDEDAAGSDAGAAYIFTRSGTTWSQQAKIVASDAQASDSFGSDVDISGETVVVGASREDTGGSESGAAYIFTRSGTSWSQQAKIQASDKASGDEFGQSIGISGDTIVAGAFKEDTGGSEAGSAYIFTRSGTTWSQQAKLQASNWGPGDQFGVTVDIDGDNVIVGAHQEDTTATDTGSVYFFTRSGTSWTESKKLQSSDVEAGDKFAYRVGIDGSYAVAGTYLEDTGGTSAGSAYAFISG